MSSQRLPLPLSQLAIALMAASASAWGVPAWGAPPSDRPPPPPSQATPRQDAHEALSDAVRRVERSTRGQVLSAERVPYDGRNINRIKIVDDRGRVRVYVDDPQKSARADDNDDNRRPPRTHDNDD